MKKYRYIKLLLGAGASLMALLLVNTCKKPFDPQLSDTETNVLVVEGNINMGTEPTNIRLSRTMRLNNLNVDYSTANSEKGATVTIEDDQGKTFPLAEGANGNYTSSILALPMGRKYQLRIKTSTGDVYLSSPEAPKNSPPIDSLGFTIGNGVQVYANTHDATNSTIYYRWDFTETWKFKTLYTSNFQSDGKDIVPRNPLVDYCFANRASNVIVLGSTVKLTRDELSKQPIMTIPSSDERIGIRYSILVKQYALTKAAYEFWSNIKRNTETLGSVFDAQPSAPIGNIKCLTDAGKPVVGYVSVGTTQTKRLFIDKSQLPAQWTIEYPYYCTQDTLLFNRGGIDETALLIPLNAKMAPLDKAIVRGSTVGYLASMKECADCTSRGTLAPPPFWK